METTAARTGTNTSTGATIKQTYDHNYALHLKHLLLNGLRPKTIEAYSRAIRRRGGASVPGLTFRSTTSPKRN